MTNPERRATIVLHHVVHLIHLSQKGEIGMELFHIDLLSRTPIYEQLYKKIVELMLKGELKANDRLPSVRDLAKELGVNPNTVSKAYSQLEHDKVIYTLAGRGSFINNVQTDSIKEKALVDFDDAAAEALKAGLDVSELHERLDKITKNSKGGRDQ